MNSERNKYVNTRRIKEYLENVERQVKDLKNLDIKDKNFFLDPANNFVTKAIKYTFACAIQDISRIAVHITSALGLWKVRDSEAEAILMLGEAGIIPKEFAEKIKRLPAFRNRIIHDYLPNEFDAERLFDGFQNLSDFAEFSKYIINWLSKINATQQTSHSEI